MKKILLLILAFLLMATVFLMATFAWLRRDARTELGITSYVHKSYFESGDGTSAIQYAGSDLTSDENCAFEIKYPVQLYYFAWLQYLGYFNQPASDTADTINQTYFYLSADLDMTGWVLPPIGTSIYPFVGNFNGNGHVIENLTVQNVPVTSTTVTTLSDNPVTSVDNLEISGFFGIIGATSNTGTVYGAEEASDHTIFTPSTEETYSYDSQINEVKNFALVNIAIKTQTDQALTGIVAGYVNGKVSDIRVGVSGAIINTGSGSSMTYTSNMSDYTLIGYATEAYKNTRDVVMVALDTPTSASSTFNYTAQGASSGFGGSIDMKDLYDRLINARSVNQRIGGYTDSEVHLYDSTGTELENPQITTAVDNTDYRQYSSAANFTDGSGSYLFRNSDSTTKYNYLTTLYKTVRIATKTDATEAAFYIKSGNTYLNVNTDHSGITTAGTNTKWILDGGHIRMTDNYGYMHFLNTTGNSLAIGTVGTTVWTKTADALQAGVNGLYLQYEGGWKLIADGSTAYYYISYVNGTTTYYLNENNGTISRTTSATSKWYRSGNNSGTLYTQSANGNTYYLYTNGNNRNLSLSTTDATTWSFNNSGEIYHSSGFYTYYICIRNNAWTCARNQTPHGIIAQGGTDTHMHTALEFIDTVENIFDVVEKTVPSLYSCLPLNAVTSAPFTVQTGNTGYIVSGAHTTQSVNGDIRVSSYAISNNISNSYNTSTKTFSTVYSINDSGRITISSANSSLFQRYSKAAEQFLTTLKKDNTDVYGLHFMDATISKNNLVTLPNALIFDQLEQDYDMPEDCIDFNVYQKGYITFFAGTYFKLNNVNNSSFFSLHTVERTDNKITAIKEIKEVWKSSDNSKDYIYYLKNEDGTYEWSGTKTAEYTRVFNSEWITQPGNRLVQNYIYYFEIPVNAGEFALGSVSGSSGAYLLYLDIAANAQLVDRGTIFENFEENIRTYEYPTGVTFQNTALTASGNIVPAATAALQPGGSGTVVSVTADNDITFLAGSINYINEGVSANNLTYTDTTVLKPVSLTTIKTKRTTYYDYNIAKNQYTVTVVTAVQTDNGQVHIKINAWNTAEDWDITGTNAVQIAIMETDFVPNIGAATENVEIKPGVSQKLDYVEVGNTYCYLINVPVDESVQTLRIDRNAFESNLTVNNELYGFAYAIDENDSSIVYNHDCNITFNADAADENNLFTFANHVYNIMVTATEAIHTAVLKMADSSDCSVNLTPIPDIM